jgi:hypothetical protein
LDRLIELLVKVLSIAGHSSASFADAVCRTQYRIGRRPAPRR